MNDKIDELLNEYIDNTLNSEQINELNERLKTDELIRKKLEALRFVDDVLRKMEVYNAPENITEKIMYLINLKTHKIKQSTKNFMISAISLLIILLITLCLIMIGIAGKELSTFSTELLSKEFANKILWLIDRYKNNNLYLLISSSVLLTLISVFYLIIESHNIFKNKMKNIR
ncbi:anti-sigma factor family protein [Rosettibacter firmus]|uniref:anti-sigma factor family protein n=1 Tax=Rosettibacter firmus TaxID=3111522 RepID=UPI00336C1F61